MNRAPAASTRANAATVRAEMVPSPRMIVPSRSVATSNGYSPTINETNRIRSAHAPRTELDTDPRAGRTGRLGHGVLPGALAAAAHDDEVSVPEVVPAAAGVLAGAGAAARPQQQRAVLAERDDGDHRVLRRTTPDGVAVPGHAVPLVPVEAQPRRDERLAPL